MPPHFFRTAQILASLLVVSLGLTALAGAAGSDPECRGGAAAKKNCPILVPTDGATVSGTTSVTATFSNPGVVAGVQFSVDGSNLGAEDTTAPFTVSWNTTSKPNGSHELAAVAREAGGSLRTSAVTVNVSNQTSTPDTTPPSAQVTAPTNGTTVNGTVNVNANATDNVAVVGVQFKLDGANLGAEDTSAPYTTSWNTTTASNAGHTLTAVARDAAGNTTTTTQVGVTVNNATSSDTTPPSAQVTAPTNGTTVNGTVNVNANATDNVAVVGVQFKLDGANLGAEDTSAPYTTSWNTTTASNAGHTLTAVARDAAGNTTTTTQVGVTVNNATSSGPKLTWAPPALTNPITINVPDTNGALFLDPTKDYIVRIGHLRACTGLWLEGGHNIVVIGGRISVDAVCNGAYDRTAVKVRFNTGVVHLEGLLLDGAYLHDGIAIAAPNATVQLQNIRVSGTRTIDANHPDCVHVQAGAGSIRTDRFTCVTQLQGFFLGDHTGMTGPTTLKHVNMIGAPGRVLFWKSDTRPTSPGVTLSDCWLAAPTPWAPSIGHWVYPTQDGDTVDFDPWGWPEGGLSRRAVVSSTGGYVSFTGTNIVGGFSKGTPPGGDFVPASTVGTTYVSPGYGA